jgi:Flp pilus assembly protein TadG
MYLKREEGAAAVEFALVLPILLVLVFGIIEFGMILYFQGVVASASREGARHGIVVSKPTDVKEWTENYSQSFLPSPGGTADVAYGSGDPGTPLTVTVRYDYTYIVIANLIPGLTSDGMIHLASTTTMYYE